MLISRETIRNRTLLFTSLESSPKINERSVAFCKMGRTKRMKGEATA